MMGTRVLELGLPSRWLQNPTSVEWALAALSPSAFSSLMLAPQRPPSPPSPSQWYSIILLFIQLIEWGLFFNQSFLYVNLVAKGTLKFLRSCPPAYIKIIYSIKLKNIICFHNLQGYHKNSPVLEKYCNNWKRDCLNCASQYNKTSNHNNRFFP